MSSGPRRIITTNRRIDYLFIVGSDYVSNYIIADAMEQRAPPCVPVLALHLHFFQDEKYGVCAGESALSGRRKITIAQQKATELIRSTLSLSSSSAAAADAARSSLMFDDVPITIVVDSPELTRAPSDREALLVGLRRAVVEANSSGEAVQLFGMQRKSTGGHNINNIGSSVNFYVGSFSCAQITLGSDDHHFIPWMRGFASGVNTLDLVSKYSAAEFFVERQHRKEQQPENDAVVAASAVSRKAPLDRSEIIRRLDALTDALFFSESQGALFFPLRSMEGFCHVEIVPAPSVVPCARVAARIVRGCIPRGELHIGTASIPTGVLERGYCASNIALFIPAETQHAILQQQQQQQQQQHGDMSSSSKSSPLDSMIRRWLDVTAPATRAGRIVIWMPFNDEDTAPSIGGGDGVRRRESDLLKSFPTGSKWRSAIVDSSSSSVSSRGDVVHHNNTTATSAAAARSCPTIALWVAGREEEGGGNDKLYVKPTIRNKEVFAFLQAALNLDFSACTIIGRWNPDFVRHVAMACGIGSFVMNEAGIVPPTFSSLGEPPMRNAEINHAIDRCCNFLKAHDPTNNNSNNSGGGGNNKQQQPTNSDAHRPMIVRGSENFAGIANHVLRICCHENSFELLRPELEQNILGGDGAAAAGTRTMMQKPAATIAMMPQSSTAGRLTTAITPSRQQPSSSSNNNNPTSSGNNAAAMMNNNDDDDDDDDDPFAAVPSPKSTNNNNSNNAASSNAGGGGGGGGTKPPIVIAAGKAEEPKLPLHMLLLPGASKRQPSAKRAVSSASRTTPSSMPGATGTATAAAAAGGAAHRSGYLLFCTEYRAKNPGAKFTMQMTSDAWKALSAAEQQMCNDKCSEQKRIAAAAGNLPAATSEDGAAPAAAAAPKPKAGGVRRQRGSEPKHKTGALHYNFSSDDDEDDGIVVARMAKHNTPDRTSATAPTAAKSDIACYSSAEKVRSAEKKASATSVKQVVQHQRNDDREDEKEDEDEVRVGGNRTHATPSRAPAPKKAKRSRKPQTAAELLLRSGRLPLHEPVPNFCAGESFWDEDFSDDDTHAPPPPPKQQLKSKTATPQPPQHAPPAKEQEHYPSSSSSDDDADKWFGPKPTILRF